MQVNNEISLSWEGLEYQNYELYKLVDDNEELNSVIDKVDWYYKENEHFFDCRRRDLIS